jgi:hypothetical protein
MKVFCQDMHQIRTSMTPFPGTDKQAEALVSYLQQLPVRPQTLPGVQSARIGVSSSSKQPAVTANAAMQKQ